MGFLVLGALVAVGAIFKLIQLKNTSLTTGRAPGSLDSKAIGPLRATTFEDPLWGAHNRRHHSHDRGLWPLRRMAGLDRAGAQN
jgi:hypothetical protein